MRRNGNQIQFSPSDLMTFMQSPFASWMNRFKLEYPDKAPAQDEDDELSTFLQNKGFGTRLQLHTSKKLSQKALPSYGSGH